MNDKTSRRLRLARALHAARMRLANLQLFYPSEPGRWARAQLRVGRLNKRFWEEVAREDRARGEI
jgi:hypothetical protein